MLKKLVSLNLAVLLLIGLLTIGASAAGGTGYAVYYDSASDTAGGKVEAVFTKASNDKLMIYGWAGSLTRPGAAGGYVTSFKDKDTGETYKLTDKIEDVFSEDKNDPTGLVAQVTAAVSPSVMFILPGSAQDYKIVAGKEVDSDDMPDVSRLTNEKGEKIIAWKNYSVRNNTMFGVDGLFPVQTTGGRNVITPIYGDNYVYYIGYRVVNNTNTVASLMLYGSKYGNSMPDTVDTYTRVFIGWNTKEDGSGDWYSEDADVDALPHYLFGIYERYPSSYCVIKCPEGLENGQMADVLTLSNGSVTLPTKLKDGTTVSGWKAANGVTYRSGTPVSVPSGSVLTPVAGSVVEDNSYLGVFNGNGGVTADGKDSYSRDAYKKLHVTSGNMITYSFNFSEVPYFYKDGYAMTGFKAVDGTVYGFDTDAFTAFQAEANAENIATFTVEYTPVEGDFVQYFGAGAKTSGGAAYSTVAGTTAAANMFAAPAGKVFLGWNTVNPETVDSLAQLSGTWYSAGNTVTLPSGKDHVALYAVWGDAQTESHRVEYIYPNSQKTTRVSGAVSEPASWLVGEGNIFLGWNTKKDGTGTWYCSGEELDSNDPSVLTLYAVTQEAPAYYYVLRQYIDGQKEAEVVSMSAASQTVTLKKVNELGWHNTDISYGVSRGFLDELPDGCIVPGGQPVTVKSGTEFVPFTFHHVVKFHKNIEGDNEARYFFTTPTSLALPNAESVFGEVEELEFTGWTRSANGGSKVHYRANRAGGQGIRRPLRPVGRGRAQDRDAQLRHERRQPHRRCKGQIQR